jgi:hypothetical protein
MNGWRLARAVPACLAGVGDDLELLPSIQPNAVTVHLERDEAPDGELVQSGMVHAQDARRPFRGDPVTAPTRRGGHARDRPDRRALPRPHETAHDAHGPCCRKAAGLDVLADCPPMTAKNPHSLLLVDAVDGTVEHAPRMTRPSLIVQNGGRSMCTVLG